MEEAQEESVDSSSDSLDEILSALAVGVQKTRTSTLITALAALVTRRMVGGQTGVADTIRSISEEIDRRVPPSVR